MTPTLPTDAVGSGTATEREITQQPDVWRETARLVASCRAELGAFLAPLPGRRRGRGPRRRRGGDGGPGG
jgi:hypothetical protein